jgi:hypothetical protein
MEGAVLMRRREMPRRAHRRFSRPLPRSLQAWLEEIVEAIADAAGTKPFGQIIGTPITDGDLFHLAPLVCLKFRGREIRGPEAERVTETALANYVVNSDPDGIDHDLAQKPILAFAVCYVAAHLALDLLDEQEAEAVLNYCEKHMSDG